MPNIGSLWKKVGNTLQPANDEPVSIDQAVIAELAARFRGSGSRQSIANTTATTVSNVEIVFEDTAIADADSTTGKITVQKAGGYVVSGIVHWRGVAGWSAGDTCLARIVAGGSDIVENDEGHDGSTRVVARPLPAVMVNLSANDTIFIEVFQNSGGTKEVENNTKKQFALSVHRLRQ